MKSMRERYFAHFEKIQTPADNRRGFRTEYRYKSDYYGWDENADALKRRRILYFAAELLSIVIYLIAATRKTELNSIQIAAGFSVSSIVPWLAEIWGVVRFGIVKSPMIIPDFNEIKEFIIVGSVVRCVLLAVGMFCGLFLIIRAGQMSVLNLLVFIGHLASAAISLLLFRWQSSLRHRIFRNLNGRPGPEI